MIFFSPVLSGGALGVQNMGEYLIDDSTRCLVDDYGNFLISSNTVSLLSHDDGRTLDNESGDCLLAIFEE